MTAKERCEEQLSAYAGLSDTEKEKLVQDFGSIIDLLDHISQLKKKIHISDMKHWSEIEQKQNKSEQYDLIEKQAEAIYDLKGMKPILNLLQKYGVLTLKDIPYEKLDEVLKDLTNIIEEENT